LKEIAMKTFIIATILSVGVLLRPGMVPAAHDTRFSDNEATAVGLKEFHTSANILLAGDLEELRGAGIIDCYEYFDGDFDLHQMCCLNLWLFKICGDINISAVQRLVGSLF
jgi:hypothetical protein